MDNFDRQLYFVFGASSGVLITAVGGWAVGLGWLIGGGIGGLIMFAFVTGRLRLGRKAVQ